MKKIIALISVLILTAAFLQACGKKNDPSETTQNDDIDPRFVYSKKDCFAQYSPQQKAAFAEYSKTYAMQIEPRPGDTIATLETNFGDIKILLYTDDVPEMVKNFTQLASQKKYDNTPFHRIIECFMIQGGDFTNQDGSGGHSYKGVGTNLPDEFSPKLKHLRGAVSMANSGPNTNGSQFFIVQGDYGAPWLDGIHSIFGFVYEGMDVIDKMAQVKTDQNAKPLQEVLIEEVVIDRYQ